MVGTIPSADSRFNDPSSKVSAHYGVGFDGTLVHWVDEDNTAYHSGDYEINQRSIGIEHEDYNKPDDPRPDALYHASAALVADLCRFYSIPCDRTHIRKHNEIVATHCPGTLDVDRIVREAQNLLSPVPPKPVFNDQSVIDLGGQLGSMEVQAIRSHILDLERDYKGALAQAGDLKRQLSQSQDQVEKLKQQLALAASTVRPSDPPKTAEKDEPGSVIIADLLTSFLNWLKRR